PDLRDISMIPGRFRLVRGLVKRFKPLNEEIDEEAILWSGILSALSLTQATNILENMGTPHNQQVTITAALQALDEVPGALSSIEENDSVSLFFLLKNRPLEALITLMAYALEKQNTRKILHFITDLRNIKPVVTGDDLKSLGIPAGPHMRLIFQKILELKLRGNPLDREKELEIALQEYKSL
ncbi:MAG: hypothetical protein AB1403_11445, partial [Candidatus Riflebacteria bacterium]